MSAKISVAIIKAKSVDTTSDLNKMVVHLEQILTEKDGVEVKTRQSVTDALIKGADYVVFAGWDTMLLSSLFATLNYIEKQEVDDDKKIFLFDEPGDSCWQDINRLLTTGMDLGRIDSKLFQKIEDCWNYRDIMSYIDVKLRKIEANANTGDSNTEQSV
jgi:hypothetical protein